MTTRRGAGKKPSKLTSAVESFLEGSDQLSLVELLAVAEEVAAHEKDPDLKTIYSVSELTAYIEGVLEADPLLGGPLIVQGELSNVKRSSRGHVYFTLKDGRASINGILWASTASRLKFDLEDGLEVFLTGRLEIYAPSGTYSIVGQKMEPVGVGALQLAFQQIKEKLEAEGLFSDEYKQELPELPSRIGIVTSKTGAVIHDMLRVIRQKNPALDVLISPVAVQGPTAAQEIADAIRRLNWISATHADYALDAIIVARGGGSFEDLFCFSEEPVVRAIFESAVPIVTGIGHEPDYSLADAAADYSAATPTAAADWVVPDWEAIVEAHQERGEALIEQMNEAVMLAEYELDQRATRFVELVNLTLESEQKTMDQVTERLTTHWQMATQRWEQRLSNYASQLNAFNPLDTLARGYTLTSRVADGQLVTSVKQLIAGERIVIRFADGQAPCQVESEFVEDGLLERDLMDQGT